MEQKYGILLGFYVGFWGMLQLLTVKLVAVDMTWLDPLIGSWFSLGVLGFSYGSFVHAFTFPCTDAVAEVWGAKRARFMVYLGFCMYALSTILVYVATKLPSSESFQFHDEYNAIFEGAPRIVAGSMVATIFAQLWDIFIFEKIKKLTGTRMLWLRNNLSTWGSQFLDTVLFYTIAFYGIIPNDILPGIIIGGFILKILVAAIDTPMVYLLVYWITGSFTARGDLEEKTAEESHVSSEL